MFTKQFKDDNMELSIDNNILIIKGQMRYPSLSEYRECKRFLWESIPYLSNQDSFVINIECLEYMNSSGQAIINMFILELKKNSSHTQLSIYGTCEYEWQEKFLYTAKQLWNSTSKAITLYLNGIITQDPIKKFKNVNAWK